MERLRITAQDLPRLRDCMLEGELGAEYLFNTNRASGYVRGDQRPDAGRLAAARPLDEDLSRKLVEFFLLRAYCPQTEALEG